MSGPTVRPIGPTKMTERHPRTARVGESSYSADELARENDARILARAARSLVDGLITFLESQDDWQATVAKQSARIRVWEQVQFAHELLDRLMAVMLADLDRAGWREETTDERILPL